MKKCSKCQTDKDQSEFYKDRSRPDGLNRYCKACNKAKNRKWYENNVDRVDETSRAWRKENRESFNQYAREANSARRAALADSDMPRGYWTHLIRFYGAQCLSCGSTGPLTHDHVIPLSHGGPHDLRNAQILCGKCNSGKQARHATDFRDYQKGVLAGIIFDQQMILSSPPHYKMEM